MDNQFQNGNDKDRLDFATGKSFGLVNKPKKIEEYRDKLKKAGDELLSEAESREKAVTEQIEKLKVQAENLVLTIAKAQNGVLEKLTTIQAALEKLKGGADNDTAKDSVRVKFLNYAENTFKKNLETLTLSGDTVEKLASEIRQSVTDLVNKIENKNSQFVDFTEKFAVNITEFERGYLYGEAIRVGLSDDDNNIS